MAAFIKEKIKGSGNPHDVKVTFNSKYIRYYVEKSFQHNILMYENNRHRVSQCSWEKPFHVKDKPQTIDLQTLPDYLKPNSLRNNFLFQA